MAKVASKLDRKSWTWFEGNWREGSPAVLAPTCSAGEIERLA
ncbi:MAG: hypothetical protein P8J29_07485 [Rhodospirillales bacterium]|nr:hypothetical protein [Rhodospirillales bacterium]